MLDTLDVYVSDQKLRFFSGFSLMDSIDEVGGSFGFTSPFFPESRAYRDLFKPFKYQRVRIDIGGDRVFTGRVESVDPSASESSSEVAIAGRSLPGVLVDVTFEYDDFPLQFTSAGLKEIADKLVAGYDFAAVFESSPGAIFSEAGPTSPTETIFIFIQNLARQRQLLMGQTAAGDLLFRRAVSSGRVVAVLKEGQQGVIVSGANYNGAARFSSIESFGQEYGVNDNYSRAVDRALAGVRRPKAIQANDTNEANISQSAEWALSAQIAEAITVPLQVEGWRDPNRKLWSVNTLLNLTAPSIMIYKPFTFLIKSVTFKRDDNKDITELALTIPGAYSGKLPEAYPWDD